MLRKLLPHNLWLASLITGFVSAVFFSAFIFFSHYGIENRLLNSVTALIGFYLLLHIDKKALLFAGFFIGILWFYWVSYSFKYNGVGYVAPFVVFGFGVVYALFFGVAAFTDKAILRALIFFAMSYVEPVGFNWMQLSLPFVESYFGISKWQLAVVLLALSLDELIPKPRLKPLAFLLLLFAVQYRDYPPRVDAPIRIKLVQTNVPQDKKWKKEMLYPTLDTVFSQIENAIVNQYDLVVLPESVIPLFLNRHPAIIDRLLLLSEHIDIVLGALLIEDKRHYNVTYHFYGGKGVDIAKKSVLVPFGEYIPLPGFLKKFVNDVFFAGASDFVAAKHPSDFIVKGVRFRNAICYEATSEKLFADHPKYMIATSNNAWFAPSIEPTLQNLLMRYYARLYTTTIYHSANYAGTGVVK